MSPEIDSAAPGPPAHLRVLIVDDNEDARIILGKVLDAAGHEVLAAASGQEALSRLERERPDVVISDVLMPGMDGYELCRRARQSPAGRELPFVFYTSNYVDPEDARLARDLGASAFITKPADPGEVMSEVDAVLRRLRRGELPVPRVSPDASQDLVRRHRERLTAQLDDKVEALRATQQALAASQARLHRLVGETPVVIYGATPGAPRELTYVSGNAARVLGYSAAELIGPGALWGTRLHPEDAALVLDTIARAAPGQSVALEYRFHRADGQWRWIQDDFVVRRPAGAAADEAVGYWVDVTDRKQAEQAEQRAREQLRRLTVQLQQVREEERRGIAREVHDDLGQLLTGIKLELSWIGRRLGADDPDAAARARSAMGLIDDGIRSVQALSRRLRPSLLEDLGLVAAVEGLLGEVAGRADLPWELEVDVGRLEPDEGRDITVFRVLQEALTNVVRHARASRVDVSLRRERDDLVLAVRDDGAGIAPAEPWAPGSLGLAGMRERVLALGGEFRVGAGAAGGAEVLARLPVAGVGSRSAPREPRHDRQHDPGGDPQEGGMPRSLGTGP